MEKGYNIDDILSEVQKRRQETEEQIKSEAEEISADSIEEKVKKAKEKLEEKPEEPAQEEAIEETVKEAVPEATEEEQKAEPEEGFVDASAILEQGNDYEDYYINPTHKPKNSKKKKKGKGKKVAITVLCILLVLVIGAGVGAWFYVNNVLNNITQGNENQSTTQESMAMDHNIEVFNPIEEADASQIASLKDMIKQWYYNGTPCSSSKVLNIMLIGEDTRGKEILDDGTRADSAIIASINTETNQIRLTSILRDTYAYWETTKGDESTGQFGKINGAMSTGDVRTYCNTVENLYKIKIDNYVIVNFTSFEKIIDVLGGVELELTSAEINEINNHQKRYGGVHIEKTFDGTKGTLKLNGKQALAYCRIRKIDSDNMRANRQKICLNKVFDGMKGASNVQLLKILNEITPYVKTDMSKNNIVKTAKYALKNGWMNYKVSSGNIPEYRNDERGSGGIFYGAWCWKADFPMDAYMLQMDIYGKSNITLARTRVDYIACREQGFYSEGSYPTSETYINEHYGEVTTRPAETTTENVDKMG